MVNDSPRRFTITSKQRVLDNDQCQFCLAPIVSHYRALSLSFNFVSRVSFNHTIIMIKKKKVITPAIYTHSSVTRMVNMHQASPKAKSSLFYFQVGPYASIPSPYHSARSIYQSGAGPQSFPLTQCRQDFPRFSGTSTGYNDLSHISSNYTMPERVL